jgi:hypothetical protein
VGRVVGPAPGTVALVGTEQFLVRALIAVGQMVGRRWPCCGDFSEVDRLLRGLGPIRGCSLHRDGESFGGEDVERLVEAACAEAHPALAHARSVVLHVETGEIGSLHSVNGAACFVSECCPEAAIVYNSCRTDAGEIRVTLLWG